MTTIRFPKSSHTGSRGLSAAWAHQLGALLLQIRAVADDEVRTDLIRDVEEQLGSRLAVSRDRDSGVDAARIVQACGRHAGGLEAVVRAVHRIAGDSLPYEAFARACAEASTSETQSIDAPPRAGERAIRRGWLLAAAGAAMAVLVTVVVYKATNSGGRPPAVDVIHAGQHKLTESNFVTTNHLDKIDLDTGHPGHGGQPQGAWNPERDGRLADLIVESDRIHTRQGLPS